jgi:hypothetical protein
MFQIRWGFFDLHVHLVTRICSLSPTSDALDYIVRLWVLHYIQRKPPTDLLEFQDFQECYTAWFSLPSFEPAVLAQYLADFT